MRVPNTWYRAALEWPDGPNVPPHRLIGVTLPGVPAIVVGSNTHVAWGFTNSQGDWSDIVLLEIDPSDPNRYRTPEGWRAFDNHDETIEVAGEESRARVCRWTIWGPVMHPDHQGRFRAFRWVAHDASGSALDYRLESALTIEEAFDAVNGLGAPGQNFVVADDKGHIGWTIYGSIARRMDFDGRLPASWADGTRGWSGWLNRDEYPRVLDPENGRIWTANARVVDGDMLARIGDGNYEVGSRARIIRERLESQDRFTVADLLSIQLDTSAEFLTRWRTLPARRAEDGHDRPARARLREIVERDWDGHASPGSAGYRLTRMFREEVSEAVMAFVLIECDEADATFDYRFVRRREGPIWKLVSEKPLHLLDPNYANWDELILRAATDVVVRAEREGGSGRAVVNVECHGLPPSAVIRAAPRGPVARHAATDAARRPLHAQHALDFVGLVGADDRLTRSRERRDHAHADRPERPSALAVLRELTSSMGEWRCHAVSARTDGLHADADALISKSEPYPPAQRRRPGFAAVNRRIVTLSGIYRAANRRICQRHTCHDSRVALKPHPTRNARPIEAPFSTPSTIPSRGLVICRMESSGMVPVPASTT